MKFFKQSQKQRNESNRKRRLRTGPEHGVKETFERGRITGFFLYLGFGLLAAIICFAGLSSAGPLVQEGQVSRIRITSEIPFSYVSEMETARRMEAVRQKVPPVFRLDLEPFRNFRSYLEKLAPDLASFAAVPENTPADLAQLQTAEVEEFLKAYPEGNPYGLRPSDLATLYNQLGPERFAFALREGIIILGEVARKGVYKEDTAFDLDRGQSLTLFNVEDEFGNIQRVEILSEEEALRTLRIQLAAVDIPRESMVALFRILRTAMDPNLLFDASRTKDRVLAAQEAVEPVRIQVGEGETIVEPNSRVTAFQYEQLEAYRKAVRQSNAGEFGLNSLFFERSMLTILLVLGAVFFLKTSRHRMQHNHRISALSGGLILFNLALIRLVIELGDSVIAESTPVLVQILPYLTPIIIGPVVITILVGAGPGILSAGLVSTFNAMMQGNSLSILLLSQLVCLVAITYCRNIQLRASLVRAGTISGSVMAAGALLFGLRDNLDLATVLYQVLTGIGTGLLSGILVVGLLPIFENLFKYTTDITLLELTDFNHPLLRKMQLEAPGSYHHSLMVANLSDNAAHIIGANPLVCRVCSLFHDIGKITKPEYFAENQRSGQNPHIERNPSMSALVIKSHVKEGVQMARQYHLPKIIIDVIQQHHGTSLIQYFYYKALERQKADGSVGSISPNAPRIELNQVNEDTYRYEGPIPRFSESALIMLADSVEAASRSLKKVNPQSVEELVEKIFLARMQDGQLDDTPLTFKQLQQIKDSFVFTLMNMLHARVEYPEGKPEEGAGEKRSRKKGTPHPFETPSAPPPEE
ncbi:MAG: HDIG domain-containing protein [Oceanipulchritudo sp.]